MTLQNTTIAPAFKHHSPFDYGVMLWGGECPRTGFPQQPLEFQFFAKFFSRAEIEAKAAELAAWHHRTHYAIQAPSQGRKLARAA